MLDVQTRLEQLQSTLSGLRLYALIDGVQYQALRHQWLQPAQGLFPLFAGTPNAPLMHAGPWLVDTARLGEAFVAELGQLEQQAPSLIWLMAIQDLEGLAQLMQLHLDAQLPDGRHALLRFWDPRVLVTLAQTLDDEQRRDFFGHVHEWHLLHEGQRAWIGRPHAQAH